MSERNSQPRDRTPIYLALIAAGATLGAALIGVLPSLLNSRGGASVVITATAPPPTAARAETQFPVSPTTVVASPVPPLPAPSPTPRPAADTQATLLLVNNLAFDMEFFVDDQSVTTIQSGTYQPLKVIQGRHEFRQCVVGTDYTSAENCFAKEFDLQASPEVWTMFDASNPLTARGDVVLLVLNRAPIAQDVFVDAQMTRTIPPGAYAALTISTGAHSVQPCAEGTNPASGTCGARIEITASQPTDSFLIHGD